MNSKLAVVFVLLILVGIGGFLGYLKFTEPPLPSPEGPGASPPSYIPSAPSDRPFWGCGLVGKDIDPSKTVWQALAGALKGTNSFGKVSTWNWDTAPQRDEKLSGDFLFFPESQCGGISEGQEQGFPQPGDSLGGATVASMALGSNEPDQPGFCQTYGPPPGEARPLKNCDSEMMRKGQCKTPPNDCTCFDWDAKKECKYDVTGCGMWPVMAEGDCSSGDTAPFPYQCFGAQKLICDGQASPETCCDAKCRTAAALNFNAFYREMGNRGYTYATAPLVASDLAFSQDIMAAAGCDAPEVTRVTGNERLRKGCPTHSAFHFYSTGCPEPGASIQGFKDKVQAAKRLNSDFNLAGAVVNELGSLDPESQPCAAENISGMMSELFEYLQTEEAQGVVSQMVWFNQNKTGGTFDLRLVDDEAQKLTPLGEQYQRSCLKWAASNGVRASAI